MPSALNLKKNDMIIIHIGIQIYHGKDSVERGLFFKKYRFFFSNLWDPLKI